MCDARVRGFPKFTNEVQHFIEVLPWDSNGRRHDETNGRDGNHPSRIGVRESLMPACRCQGMKSRSCGLVEMGYAGLRDASGAGCCRAEVVGGIALVGRSSLPVR